MLAPDLGTPSRLRERGLSPIQALSASFELVKANLGQSLLLAVLAVLILIVGACLCLIGLLAAYPIVALATAYAYKRFHDLPVAA